MTYIYLSLPAISALAILLQLSLFVFNKVWSYTWICFCIMALTFVDLAVMEWWSWGLDCRTIRYNKILLQFTVLYTIHVNTVNCHHLKTVSMQYHVRQRPNCKYIQTIRMVTIHKWSFIFDGKVYSLNLNKMSTILNQCIRNKSF